MKAFVLWRKPFTKQKGNLLIGEDIGKGYLQEEAIIQNTGVGKTRCSCMRKSWFFYYYLLIIWVLICIKTVYRHGNTNPKEPVHPNVHSSTIYNSQVLETA